MEMVDTGVRLRQRHHFIFDNTNERMRRGKAVDLQAKALRHNGMAGGNNSDFLLLALHIKGKMCRLMPLIHRHEAHAETSF